MENEKNKWRGDEVWCAAKFGREWEAFVQTELRVSSFRLRAAESASGARRRMGDWVEDVRVTDEEWPEKDEHKVRVSLPLGNGFLAEFTTTMLRKSQMVDFDVARDNAVKHMLGRLAEALLKERAVTENWRCA